MLVVERKRMDLREILGRTARLGDTLRVRGKRRIKDGLARLAKLYYK